MFNESFFELNLLGISLLFGMFCAFLFDWFRVLRRVVRTGTLAACAEDAAFWVLAALCFFGLCLKFNNGEIRLFMLGGTVIGAVLYFKTISRFAIGFFVRAIKLVRRILSAALKVLLFPLKLLVRLLGRPFFCVLSFGKKGVAGMGRNMKFHYDVFRKFSFFSAFRRNGRKTPKNLKKT